MSLTQSSAAPSVVEDIAASTENPVSQKRNGSGLHLKECCMKTSQDYVYTHTMSAYDTMQEKILKKNL